MKIGSFEISNPVVAAPMAGVTDLPFRRLCKRLGAGLVVSEMISARPELRNSKKTLLRMNHRDEVAPIMVQIAGSDAQMLADAARYNVDHGAQIIDINMGCPAKKVCNKAAGSALLKDENLVMQILTAVVKAVNVPVTLKIRTGWDSQNKNAVHIAKIAQDCGIRALAVHGRTRACKFQGHAEHQTVGEIKSQVTIPVMANGDISCPEQAKQILDFSGADAIMIGRAAQGRPWIFREVSHFLSTGQKLAPPSIREQREILLHHIRGLHDFYGEHIGVRVARKHVGWYLKALPESNGYRKIINSIEEADQQLSMIAKYFEQLEDIVNEEPVLNRIEQAA